MIGFLHDTMTGLAPLVGEGSVPVLALLVVGMVGSLYEGLFEMLIPPPSQGDR